MSITLRQLSIFETIARVGKLTHAAEQLAMSQSAASQALKELETALGYALFQRVGRDLIITEAGARILPKVGRIAQWVDDLKQPDPNEISGVLNVAASVTIASYVLPHLLARFIAQHPQVQPDVMIANTRQVLDALEKGRAQLGLIEGPAVHNRLRVIPWQSDHLQVFCHAQHPLSREGVLSVPDMARERWVLREVGSGTRAIFDAAVQKVGAELGYVLALNRQEAIKQSVKAGLGLGCLSHLSIADEVKRGDLVVLNTKLELTRYLSLVTHAPEQNSTLVNGFIEFVVGDY